MQELERRAQPRSFDVIDAGTSLGDLLPLLARYDRVILVDAIRAGRLPGSICEVEIHGPEDLERTSGPLSLHELGLAEVLEQARFLNLLPRQIILVGVEPAHVAWGIGLSEPVQKAMECLIYRIQQLVETGELPSGNAPAPAAR